MLDMAFRGTPGAGRSGHRGASRTEDARDTRILIPLFTGLRRLRCGL